MSLQVSTNPYVSATTQTIAMSSIFSVSPDASNSKYLYLAADDYNVYAGPASASSAGTLYGNGHSLALTVQGTTNLREAGILFTYNTSTGQYVNATYGNVTNVTFTSSGTPNDVTDISFYATDSAFGTTSLPQDTYSLMVYSGYGYLGDGSNKGTVTVLTSTATPFAPNAERNATPMTVANVARTFVGQTCDENGCWVLGSTISALAGASLPFAALNTDPGSASGSGEWFVAYNGSTATNKDFQSTLRVGDIVSFVTTAGTGHVTTVVAGSGRSAMLLDNASFGYNRIGGTDDLIIQAQHPQNQELDGVDATTVTIYRLDAPVVTRSAPTVALDQTNTLALASNFSATDPTGMVLTRYEVRLGNAADILANSGIAVAMSSNGTYSVSSLAGVKLMAQSVNGNHSVAVRAYNGAYWGDWANSSLTPNAAGSISQPITTPTTAIASLALSADTGASGTDFVTNQANQTISGTLTAVLGSSESVLVSVNGGITWMTATTTGAAFSTNAMLQVGGGIMAKVTSAGGNGPVAVQSYVLDTTAPEAPTNIHISADSGISASDFLTNVAIQTITATLAVPLTVGDRLFGTTGAAVPMDLTAFVVGSTLTWQGAALNIGGGSIRLTIMDLAGNASADGNQAYDLRTALPMAYSPFLAPAADSGIVGDGITNVTTPTFTGSASTGGTVQLYDTDGTTLLGTSRVDGIGRYSVTSTRLGDGVHAVTVRLTDDAGNQGAPTAPTLVTIDTTAPPAGTPALSAVSDSGVVGDFLTNVRTPTITGTAETGSVVSLYDTDGVTLLGTTTAANGTYSIATATLYDGIHTITASIADAAGNASVTTAPLVLTIDATSLQAPLWAPYLSSDSDSGIQDDGITNAASPTIKGTLSAANTTVGLYDTDGTTLLGTGVSNAYGDYAISTSMLFEGMHLLRMRVIDQAGNFSTASPSLALKIDRVMPNTPATPTLDGLAAGLLDVSATTARGTAEANGTVTVMDGFTTVATAVVDGTGHWNTALLLADGVHSISAYETDVAGNASGTSSAATVLVDTALPVVIVPVVVPPVVTPVATTTEPPDPIHVEINPTATQASPTVVPKTADDAGMTFRFFDSTHGTQFMTSSISEKNALIASRPDLAYEGAGMGTVQSDPDDKNVASVYRFFSKVDGTHFFTTDAGEKNQTIATRSDLTFEGTNFNEHITAQAGDVAVYRFFNGTNGSHFFTSSDAERASISTMRPDMVNEGIAFYAPKV